jgi:DNA mismatch repair protein MutS2
MMDAHAAKVLDFNRLLGYLAQGAKTPQGARACLQVAVASAPEEATERLVELTGFSHLVAEAGFAPVDGMREIEPHLESASTEGACLDVEALLEVRDTVAATVRVVEYLEDAQRLGSPIGEYARGHEPLYELEERFARTFGVRGEILDTASPELARLRAEIKSLRSKVLNALQRVLRNTEMEHVVRDDFITQRSNRYVIPMTTDFRGTLGGVVLDHSRSGQTVFVEPMEVVEINNRVGCAHEEEAVEIRRILMALTARLGAHSTKIRGQMAVVAVLDLFGAKLRLSRKIGGTQPEICAEALMELHEVRHPLLALREGIDVVPIALTLGEAERLLLITGANAGGKTVALKTAGLVTMMAHAGLFIPAKEGARVGWFPLILADIGDEQDIDRDLSTFSAHMARLAEVFDKAGEAVLVLLDEMGTGTDPGQGAALAVAVLEELAALGTKVVATTHLDGVKAYTYCTEGATNAAVAFDPDTGSPLYTLNYGQAGTSNAMDVAVRMGVPTRVTDRARAVIGDGGDSVGRLIGGLEDALEEARLSKAQTERKAAQLQGELEAQKVLTGEAKNERRLAREQARGEAKETIQRMREKLSGAVRDLSKGTLAQRDAQKIFEEAAKEVERRFPRPEATRDGRGPARIEVGNTVFVRSLGREGVIEALAGTKKVQVRVRGMLTTVKADELAAPDNAAAAGGRAKSRAGGSAKKNGASRGGGVKVDAEKGSPDIILIGKTVEEALGVFDNAVDRALVSGIDRFRVVHGRGSGALRRAVRQHIEESPVTERINLEDTDDAITWVELI